MVIFLERMLPNRKAHSAIHIASFLPTHRFYVFSQHICGFFAHWKSLAIKRVNLTLYHIQYKWNSYIAHVPSQFQPFFVYSLLLFINVFRYLFNNVHMFYQHFFVAIFWHRKSTIISATRRENLFDGELSTRMANELLSGFFPKEAFC